MAPGGHELRQFRLLISLCGQGTVCPQDMPGNRRFVAPICDGKKLMKNGLP